MEDEGNWYDGYELSDEHLATVSRYDSFEDYNKAFFEQRAKISESISRPNLEAEGDDLFKEISAYKVKGGGVEKAEDVSLDGVPDDVMDFLQKNAPENFFDEMKETFARLNLTPAEIKRELGKVVERTQGEMARMAEADETVKNERLTRDAEVEDGLKKLWGPRYEKRVESALAVPKYYDSKMFDEENGALSEEERAEKGGVFEQEIRRIEEQLGVQPYLRRFLADVHGKLIAEGQTPAGAGPGQSQSVFEQRLAIARQQYPEELAVEIAKGTVPLGVS